MKKIYIWGTGIISSRICKEVDVFDRYDVIGFIDNDRSKWGSMFFNRKVFSPEELLKNIDVEMVVILLSNYQDVIRQIQDMTIPRSIEVENPYFFYKEEILLRYSNTSDKEIREVISFIDNNGLQVFNYDFAKDYKIVDEEVYFDNNNGLFYVKYKNINMYFAKRYDSIEKVKEYYKSILVEQNEKSPHRYLSDSFFVKKGDSVIDVGAAEGNFAIDIIDIASHVYLVEADSEWVEALNYTFQNYLDKVTIIEKYADSVSLGKRARLDSLIDEKIDMIKLDIEGYEYEALLGAKAIFEKSDCIKCIACAYHSDTDEILISKTLNDFGLKTSVSDGYMWFPSYGRKNYISTKLVRGLVRGQK